VLQQADIRAGIAGFQNANRRPNIDPVCRFVIGAEMVILRVARRDAEENIVSRKELDIAAHTELLRSSGKAEQPGASIDLGKVFTRVCSRNGHGARAVRIQRLTNACSAPGQGRRGPREESL
jgi:hypothetical protein